MNSRGIVLSRIGSECRYWFKAVYSPSLFKKIRLSPEREPWPPKFRPALKLSTNFGTCRPKRSRQSRKLGSSGSFNQRAGADFNMKIGRASGRERVGKYG